MHEVETTVDFCPRNPVLTWVLGGLNFQIEHHLFPRVPHTHYPQIAEIVRRNCERTASATRRSPHSGPRCVRTRPSARVGRLGVPVEIEWADSLGQAASLAAASYQASSSSHRRIVGPLPRGENQVTVGVVTGSLWAIRWSR